MTSPKSDTTKEAASGDDEMVVGDAVLKTSKRHSERHDLPNDRPHGLRGDLVASLADEAARDIAAARVRVAVAYVTLRGVAVAGGHAGGHIFLAGSARQSQQFPSATAPGRERQRARAPPSRVGNDFCRSKKRDGTQPTDSRSTLRVRTHKQGPHRARRSL